MTSNNRVLEHQLKKLLEKQCLVKSRPYALWHLKPFVCGVCVVFARTRRADDVEVGLGLVANAFEFRKEFASGLRAGPA